MRCWLAIVLAGAACSAKPGNFSGGTDNQWTFPLVGPLENGSLVTPVFVGSHGPYLFVLDPDAPISVVDGELVKESELTTVKGTTQLDETNTPQPRVRTQLVSVEVGTLIIDQLEAIVVRKGTFDSGGRRIHGVLGRDVLVDQVAFGFDRDLGIAYVITAKLFRPPASGIAVPLVPLPASAPRAPIPPRLLVKAAVGGETFDLHVDLGATASQLRDGLWDKAKLVPHEVQGAILDEVGTAHKFTKASDPTAVTVGTLASYHVAFLPYPDQRFAEPAVAGTLGLGFFAPYDVWVAWSTNTLYALPRHEVPLANRVGRWETGPIQKCQNPGCVSLRIVDPLAGKPLEEGKVHPGVILSITREEKAGGMPLEVVLEAKHKPELPRLIVNLPENVDRLLDQLDAQWIGATIDVVDASPYPRQCPGKNGCVDKLAR
jgi:Aspartyl protease